MLLEPLISVIIPARNGAPFLASAMGCVVAQQYSRLEVLLIDDGSTDDLVHRCRAYGERIRYLRQEPRGPAAARNHGIRESAGDPIAFLDIDDLWEPDHLNILLRTLQEDPGAGIAQGLMRQFWTTPDGKCYRTDAYRAPYLGSCLFRRSVFEECGLFDEDLQFGEDHDLLFRCWERDIRKVNVETLSLFYRRHPGNMTRGVGQEQILVLKRRMERIRRGELDATAPREQAFQDYIGDRVQLSRLSHSEVSECDLLSA